MKSFSLRKVCYFGAGLSFVSLVGCFFVKADPYFYLLALLALHGFLVRVELFSLKEQIGEIKQKNPRLRK